MPNKEFAYESLLQASDSSEDVSTLQHQIPRALFRPKGQKWTFAICALILLVTNGTWAWPYTRHRVGESHNPVKYFDSTAELLKPFHWNTPFSDDNKTVSNPLWAGLFPRGAGLVSIEISWAQSNGLPMSAKNPEIEDHMVYFVAALHQVHCLTVIRAALFHFKEAKEQTVPWMHVTHCLDSLRQVVLCKMDDSLLYTEGGNVYGDGQVHTCGDWNALTDWATEHAFIQAF